MEAFGINSLDFWSVGKSLRLHPGSPSSRPKISPPREAFQTAKGERPGSLEMLWDFAKERPCDWMSRWKLGSKVKKWM